MIRHRTPRLPLFVLTAFTLAFAHTGCSDDNTAAPTDKLCPGQSGLGARITGTPMTIDMCVSNDLVTTLLDTINSRYWLRATYAPDTTTYEIKISFDIHTNLPTQLDVTPDSLVALGNPNGALFYYREASPGGKQLVPSAVSGTFTLTFSETDVAVGTFSDLVIGLQDASSGQGEGSREIPRGFFVVSPD